MINYIENINGKDIKIYDKGLKITDDALILADFIKFCLKNEKNQKKVLEIGAGQGVISIILSNLENILIDCVEIQKEIYEILNENIKNNGLQNKIFPINNDVKNIIGEYDYIFSNPPYRKINSGKLPEDETEKISKYEILLSLEQLFEEIKRLLKNYGQFFVIVPDDRLNDVFSYVYKNNMNILKLKIIEFKKRKLVIVNGKKGGNKNSKIEIF